MLMSLFHAITDFTPTGGELKSMISRWFLTQSCTDFHLEESLAKDYLRCLLQTTNATLAREFDDLWSEYKQGISDIRSRQQVIKPATGDDTGKQKMAPASRR